MDPLKEKKHKIIDTIEKTIKDTIDHIEIINPKTNFAWLETHMPPAKWKEYLYHWEKAKDNLEQNLLEIKEFLKKLQ